MEEIREIALVGNRFREFQKRQVFLGLYIDAGELSGVHLLPPMFILSILDCLPTIKTSLWFGNCTGLGRMVYEVIRITCHNEMALTRLVLEGKLAGACVDELDKCWQDAPDKWSSLQIDLTSVSFIDDRGKQLLKRMHDNGATLISSSIMSRCLIEELTS